MQLRRWMRFALTVLVAGMLAACAQSRPGEADLPSDARLTHKAVFIGKRLHNMVGTVSVYQSSAYPVVVLEPNFLFPDAPEAVVALGRNGFEEDASLGRLLRPSGRQAYAVPDHLQITRFNEVWLWNSRENKPLGLARLVPL